MQPAAGTIAAGGTDLAEFDIAQWRSHIAWVPQRPHLFAGSIAGNITLGRPGASPAAIRRAARQAGVADFIEGLPGDYGTLLSEGAPQLSSGQRQKIALARAFLRQSPVLLLDEPTAHLDVAAARRIGEAIDALPGRRTLIMISHGHIWPQSMGRVIALDRGRVLQSPHAARQAQAVIR